MRTIGRALLLACTLLLALPGAAGAQSFAVAARLEQGATRLGSSLKALEMARGTSGTAAADLLLTQNPDLVLDPSVLALLAEAESGELRLRTAGIAPKSELARLLALSTFRRALLNGIRDSPAKLTGAAGRMTCETPDHPLAAFQTILDSMGSTTPLILAGASLPTVVKTPLGRGEAVLSLQSYPGALPDQNEDALGVFPLSRSKGVLSVADGIGGSRSGQIASRLTMEALGKNLGTGTGALRDRVLAALDDANQGIMATRSGAGATVMTVLVDGNGVRPIHAGDAMLLVVSGAGRIKARSISHAPVAYAVEAGLLTQRQALFADDLNEITSSVGDPEMSVTVGAPLELAARDTVVLGSDGLFDNVSEAEIAEIVRTGTLEEAALRLRALVFDRMVRPRAGDPSKPDDLAFILFRLRR